MGESLRTTIHQTENLLFITLLQLMPRGILAVLMRRDVDGWGNLSLRLDEAVLQSVAENRIISDLHI